mgnify:CR=1 FL=1
MSSPIPVSEFGVSLVRRMNRPGWPKPRQPVMAWALEA